MQINRQRWLPPSDFNDQRIGSLPAPVRVTAAGLRLYVDAEGRAEVRLRKMLAEIHEHDTSITERELEEHLLRLDEANWLRLYVDRHGRSLLQVRVWPAVQHEDASQLPPPPGFMKPSRRSQETFTVKERGSERASEREGEWVRESASGGRSSGTSNSEPEAPEPPSPFCSLHQPWGTEDNCGPCGTARLAFTIWKRAAANVALPKPASRRPPADEPTEYITGDGLIETT